MRNLPAALSEFKAILDAIGDKVKPNRWKRILQDVGKDLCPIFHELVRVRHQQPRSISFISLSQMPHMSLCVTCIVDG
jgi:hypothetical protein